LAQIVKIRDVNAKVVEADKSLLTSMMKLMTPEQIFEGKRRAAAFVVKKSGVSHMTRQ
jgi:hypothetical protein